MFSNQVGNSFAENSQALTDHPGEGKEKLPFIFKDKK